jgi:FixJ family two-component response regulator
MRRASLGGPLPGNLYVMDDDDDASFRTAIKRELERPGMGSYYMNRPVLDRRPELDRIVLDARMPGLGGLAPHGHLAELGSTPIGTKLWKR